MTFDDWWKRNKDVWELPRMAPFCDAVEAFALYAWNAGFVEGHKKARRNPETSKPKTGGGDKCR